MKFLIKSFFLSLLGAPVFAQVPDEPFPYILEAQIESYRIDRDDAALSNVIGGTITLDFTRQMATLVLDQKIPGCESRDFCIQVMPPPIEIMMPIVSQSVIECGIIEYRGQSDAAAVGFLKSLVVQDFTDFYRHCKSFLPVPATSVRYIHQEQKSSGYYKLYEAYFEATKLEKR